MQVNHLFLFTLSRNSKRKDENQRIIQNQINLNPIPKMKEKFISFSLNRSLMFALVALLAVGACKSKKKAVQPEPTPAPVERVQETPPPAPAQPSAEEVAAQKLESAFNSVAGASNVSMANQSIEQTLAMFSNQQTPVLIVIHEENGIKDYDEPTTIRKYLEYLKDTKKNLNYISDIRLDANGKVSELELRRK